MHELLEQLSARPAPRHAAMRARATRPAPQRARRRRAVRVRAHAVRLAVARVVLLCAGSARRAVLVLVVLANVCDLVAE